ncbi:MAG: ParA family protein [Alphaproteobacteria bacterium]|nr:ParA family protein [Alphaproteobacteria bacterium]
MGTKEKKGRVVVITNQKGGVGKTTIARNLGEGLYNNGSSVLLIDFDTQGSLTLACGIKGYKNLKHEETIAHPFLCMAQGKKGVFPIKNVSEAEGKRLDIIPSNKTLYAVAEVIRGYPEEIKYKALGMIVNKLKPYYDYILIDTPPTISQLLQNAIAGSDECLIVSTAESLSLDGVVESVETIKDMKEVADNDIDILGVVVNDLTPNRAHQEHVIKQIKEYSEAIGLYVFKTMIPRAVSIEEAMSVGQGINEYKYSSNKAKEAFKNLTEEFLQKTETLNI